MKKLIKIAAIFSLIFVANACSTLDSVQKSKGKGKSTNFSASYDEVFDAAVKSINSSPRLRIVSKDKKEGKILAHAGLSMLSIGENVAVFVEKNKDRTIKVEVISKKVTEGSILAPNDWDSYILTNIPIYLK